MHEDDTESFQQQMSDVKRLDANRVNLSKKKSTILDLGSRGESAQKKLWSYLRVLRLKMFLIK